MNLKIALQIDPLSQLNLKRDTSLTLAFEAQQRGYSVIYYTPQDLMLHANRVLAHCRDLSLTHEAGLFVPSHGPSKQVDLSTCDVILLRQDPPFDMAYITTTFFLDHIADKVLVLNNPTAVRNCVEKLLPLEFPSLIPVSLISQDFNDIELFCQEHKEIILKPLFDFGGNSVFHVKSNEGQLKGLVELLKRSYPGLPMIAQQFMKEVITGDKRLILIDGELVGWFIRVPQKGEVRSNMLMGGSAEKVDLSAKDIEICETVGPRLRELGLFLAGLDVIGDKLIEINVTSPTGLVPLKELYGVQSEKIFWDKVEKIIENRDKYGRQYYNGRISRH